MRTLLAPTAERTANSCWRAVPRASSKIERFPQPMASKQRDRPQQQVHNFFQVAGIGIRQAADAELVLLGKDIRDLLVELLVERPEFRRRGVQGRHRVST